MELKTYKHANGQCKPNNPLCRGGLSALSGTSQPLSLGTCDLGSFLSKMHKDVLKAS